MYPRSVVTPTCSSPMFSERGFRPTARSIFSARNVSVLPPDVRASTSTPPSIFVTFSTRVSTYTAIPCRLKDAASSREISSSSTGTIRGSTSMTVVFEPKRANIEANSTPTAPEPMTSRDFGTSASSRIESDERIVLWSMSIPGSDRGEEPVAIRMFFAAKVVSEPSGAFTATLPGPAIRPKPAVTSTRFFFMR